MPPARVTWRLLGLALLVLAAILVPFALWGRALDQAVAAWLQAAPANRWAVAAVVAGLLGVDVLLPIPSSLVNTAAGYWLGLVPGALAAWVGLGLSCALGYALGRFFSGPSADRWLGPADRAWLEQSFARRGTWALALCRPVPVLAEASVVFAGLARAPLGRFGAVCALSNAGVATVYAAAGASGARGPLFLAAFALAVLLPWAALRRVRPA